MAEEKSVREDQATTPSPANVPNQRYILAREVIGILKDLTADEGDELRRERGPQALDVARRLQSEIKRRTSGDETYAMFWSWFEQDSDAAFEELIQTTVKLMKADPDLASWFRTQLEKYRNALSSLQEAQRQATVLTEKREEDA